MKKEDKVGDLTIHYYPMSKGERGRLSVVVFWNNKAIWDGRFNRAIADPNDVIEEMALERAIDLMGSSKSDTLAGYLYKSIRNQEAPTVKGYMMEVLK